MGLLDVLNGMQNGPRGEAAPGQGGMSKTTMALLAFLAYKAYKGISGSQAAPAPPPPRYPQDDRGAEREPGGLAGVLKTIFGGSSMPGPVLRRGVDNTVRDLEDRGHGDIARSWVSKGPNRQISSGQLESALGEDGVRDLMQQTGMRREELLDTLSEYLPRVIDHLTPEGRMPSDEEVRRMAG
jgi:uncharacterized protein YidB (DUF937 family)